MEDSWDLLVNQSGNTGAVRLADKPPMVNTLYTSQAYCIPSRDYTLAECIIPAHDAVKDLGVTVDSDLIFALHIHINAARAGSRANLIHTCFVSKHRDSLLRTCTAYVRPLLEYASQA